VAVVIIDSQQKPIERYVFDLNAVFHMSPHQYPDSIITYVASVAQSLCAQSNLIVAIFGSPINQGNAPSGFGAANARILTENLCSGSSFTTLTQQLHILPDRRHKTTIESRIRARGKGLIKQ
jgi:hypothetical protein